MTTKCYITNAIPYVNARPHIGFALELCISDVIARAHREVGDEVRYLTGADENSIKNVQAAEKAGIGVQEFVDTHTHIFQQLNAALNISNDDFIRTTEERHHIGAKALWDACARNGDIYKKSYEGLYCTGCETFYLEKDLVEGLCPEHKTKPELVKEENWFFKLSKYQEFLEEQYANGRIKIYPSRRANEAINFVKGGLEDFSISRSNERAKNWGVGVPGDATQKMYVWFDALASYITALGYPDASYVLNLNKEVGAPTLRRGGLADESLFKKFWSAPDAKILHVIGKGITKFHAIYWPAMLQSAGIFPENGIDILVHGYITVDGQKLSKSLGNTVDPFALVEKYGADAVRYFLLREIPTTEDGDFSEEKFIQRYNSDLANGLGNLVQRIITLAEKFSITTLDATVFDEKIEYATAALHDLFTVGDFNLNFALQEVTGLIRAGDAYMEVQAPFKSEKSPEERQRIISSLLYLVCSIGVLLRPFLPKTAKAILERNGLSANISSIDPQIKVAPKKGKPLFPRI